MSESTFSVSKKRILVAVSLLSLIAAGQIASAKQVDHISDNNGKQIAAVIPGMPHPITITVPSIATHPGKSTAPIIQTQGRTTTITMPKSVEEAVDAAYVAGNRIAKASYEKVMDLWKWAVAWYKQNHSVPFATPVGSPYVQGPVNHAHQLYFTNEGRLKTVVKQ